jgi:hypothetical protein
MNHEMTGKAFGMELFRELTGDSCESKDLMECSQDQKCGRVYAYCTPSYAGSDLAGREPNFLAWHFRATVFCRMKGSRNR